MDSIKAYWLHGTPYCEKCVNNEESPALSEVEKKAAMMDDGEGRCGCCGERFLIGDDDESPE